MRRGAVAGVLLVATGFAWTGCSSGGEGGQAGGTGGGPTGSGGRAGGAGIGSSGSAGQGGQSGGSPSAGAGGSATAGAGGKATAGSGGNAAAGSGGGATAGSGGGPGTTSTGGLCNDGWCWVSPVPQGNAILAVSARTPTDAWFVGLDGLILHWDGTGLIPYGGVFDHIYGVWAASSTFALAAAYDFQNQTEYLLRWDGTSWSRWMDTPVPVADGIWGTSQNDFWVAGSGGAAHWDGTKFTVDNTPNGDVISGAAANDIFIAPQEQTPMYHYDGHSWTQLPDPPDGVKSIAAMGGGKAWICAGTSTTGPVAAFWDGTKWTTDATMPCQYVFTPNGSDVWAVDFTDVYELSGGTWVSHFDGAEEFLAMGGTSSSSDIWAVGEGGEMVHGETQGMTEIGHGRPTDTIRSVWPVGPNEAWAASPDAKGVLQWKNGQPGAAWGSSNLRAVNDVMGRSASDLWVVGAAGLAAHYDGAAWTEIDLPANSPPTPDLYGVWENSATEVWAVGSNASTWLYDGTHWRNYSGGYPCSPAAMEPTFGHHLWSDGKVILTASGQCVMALPDKPTANSGSWVTVFTLDDSDLKGVWMTSDGYVFAAGYNINFPPDQGLLARYKGPLDGSGGGTMNVVTTERVLQDVWASSGTDAWAVGYATILHWDGSSTYTRVKLPTTTLWRIVGLPGSNELWAAGLEFSVLRHQ